MQTDDDKLVDALRAVSRAILKVFPETSALTSQAAARIAALKQHAPYAPRYPRTPNEDLLT